MSENYKPVKGDRVRVVYEGDCETDGIVRFGKWYALAGELLDAAVSVEKIEPPVEVFKPGDVVRNIFHPQHLYTLGSNGYYSHFAEKFYKPCGPFTSAEYELVHRP